MVSGPINDFFTPFLLVISFFFAVYLCCKSFYETILFWYFFWRHVSIPEMVLKWRLTGSCRQTKDIFSSSNGFEAAWLLNQQMISSYKPARTSWQQKKRHAPLRCMQSSFKKQHH